MCYATSLTKKRKLLEEILQRGFIYPEEYEPLYYVNGFEHTNLNIIKMDDAEKIYPASWGLVPEWGQDDVAAFHKKYNTLNAKQETALRSRMYEESTRERRCLILADGFFEPHHEGKDRIPYYCYVPSETQEDGRELFLFAGIYTELDDEKYSCSIFTTEANDFFAEVHNNRKRMPLVMDEHYFEDWLDPDMNDQMIDELLSTGFTTKEFAAHPVNRSLYKRGGNKNVPESIQEFRESDLFS